MAVVRRKVEVRAETALAVVAIGVGIVGAPHVAGYVVGGLGVLVGVVAFVRWWQGEPAEPPPTPAPLPRRGLTLQTENSTATQWEDGTRDVTVVPPPAHGFGIGGPATVGQPLVERMVDLSNRVVACAPNGHKGAPFEVPSAYGMTGDIAKYLAATNRDEHIADEQGVMTDELWAEVRDAIEEMGRIGYKSYRLEPYLSRRPKQGECVYLASDIFALASKMASGQTEP